MGISETGAMLAVLASQRENEERTAARLAERLRQRDREAIALERDRLDLAKRITDCMRLIAYYDESIAIIERRAS